MEVVGAYVPRFLARLLRFEHEESEPGEPAEPAPALNSGLLEDEQPKEEHCHVAVLRGSVVFADVSGFSALGRALVSRTIGGPGWNLTQPAYFAQSAEELTEVLNAYTREAVRCLHERGLDVLFYAGDAVVAFAMEGLGERPGSSAARAVAASSSIARLRYEREGISLSGHVGVGCGELHVYCARASDARRELVFAGPAIRSACEAQRLSHNSDVVISPEAWAALRGLCRGEAMPGAPTGTHLLRGFHLTAGANFTGIPGARLPSHPDFCGCGAILPPSAASSIPGAIFEGPGAPALADLPSFVLPIVADGASGGFFGNELRNVVTVFCGLPALDLEASRACPPPSAPGRHAMECAAYVRAVHALAAEYGGCVNKALFLDDKGASSLVCFGLPFAKHEDDADRGVMFALALQRLLRARRRPFACGISAGRTFCGLLGAPCRREYAVLGDHVNLAARLMGAARARIAAEKNIEEEGEAPSFVYCDAAVAAAVGGGRARQGALFEELPPLALKGWEQPVAACLARAPEAAPQSTRRGSRDHGEPAGAASPPQSSRRGPRLVGRDPELGALRGACRALAVGCGSTILLVGQAGLGKSALVRVALEELQGVGAAVLRACGSAMDTMNPMRGIRDLLFSSGLDVGSEGRLRESLAQAGLDGAAASAQILWRSVLGQGERRPAKERLSPAEERASAFATARAIGRVFTSLIASGKLEPEGGRGEAADGDGDGDAAPVAVVVEDAHWAGSLLWALLWEIRRSCPRVMILISMRPMGDPVPELQLLMGKETELSGHELPHTVRRRLSLRRHAGRTGTPQSGGGADSLRQILSPVTSIHNSVSRLPPLGLTSAGGAVPPASLGALSSKSSHSRGAGAGLRTPTKHGIPSTSSGLGGGSGRESPVEGAGPRPPPAPPVIVHHIVLGPLDREASEQLALATVGEAVRAAASTERAATATAAAAARHSIASSILRSEAADDREDDSSAAGGEQPTTSPLSAGPIPSVRRLGRNGISVAMPVLPSGGGASIRGGNAFASLATERRSARGLPAQALAAIVDKSKGIPLFLVELAKQARIAGPGVLDARGIPSTIEHMVLARVDRLPADAQNVLKLAAVAGAVVSPEILVAVDPTRLPEGRILAALRLLVDGSLLEPVPGAADGALYQFVHQLTRDAVYGSMSSSQRQRVHLAIAAWLAARQGLNVASDDPFSVPRRAEGAYQLYLHFWHGGEACRAVAFLEIAARRSFEQGALREARDLYRELNGKLEALGLEAPCPAIGGPPDPHGRRWSGGSVESAASEGARKASDAGKGRRWSVGSVESAASEGARKASDAGSAAPAGKGRRVSLGRANRDPARWRLVRLRSLAAWIEAEFHGGRVDMALQLARRLLGLLGETVPEPGAGLTLRVVLSVLRHMVLERPPPAPHESEGPPTGEAARPTPLPSAKGAALEERAEGWEPPSPGAAWELLSRSAFITGHAALALYAILRAYALTRHADPVSSPREAAVLARCEAALATGAARAGRAALADRLAAGAAAIGRALGHDRETLGYARLQAGMRAANSGRMGEAATEFRAAMTLNAEVGAGPYAESWVFYLMASMHGGDGVLDGVLLSMGEAWDLCTRVQSPQAQLLLAMLYAWANFLCGDDEQMGRWLEEGRVLLGELTSDDENALWWLRAPLLALAGLQAWRGQRDLSAASELFERSFALWRREPRATVWFSILQIQILCDWSLFCLSEVEAEERAGAAPPPARSRLARALLCGRGGPPHTDRVAEASAAGCFAGGASTLGPARELDPVSMAVGAHRARALAESVGATLRAAARVLPALSPLETVYKAESARLRSAGGTGTPEWRRCLRGASLLCAERGFGILHCLFEMKLATAAGGDPSAVMAARASGLCLEATEGRDPYGRPLRGNPAAYVACF